MIASAGVVPGNASHALVAACATGLVTAICTWLFVRLAERRGWVDDGSDAPSRKLQARPVAAIGGTAILCGAFFTVIVSACTANPSWISWARFSATESMDPTFILSGRSWVFLALLAAFTVGLVDDLKSQGLSPLQKLVGQMVAAALLAMSVASGAGELHLCRMLLWFAGAVLAQNAMNTFDNADGAAGSMALLGFSCGAPALAGAVCGFLPFNLWIRGRIDVHPGADSVPRAYLGDSGSHLLGMLLFLHPETRTAVFVPLLDLARVACVRMRLGIAPWAGDRRHLAHRMQARGWSPTATVVGLCLIATPVVGAGLVDSSRGGGWLVLGAGAAASVALFAAALRVCPSND